MSRFLSCLLSLAIFHYVSAQHTFSIVAVDASTGEVGSAGATCLDNNNIAGGALIISDVYPGRGAIHTQAYWNPDNQSFAGTRMSAGDSPQEIIDLLIIGDAQFNSSIRQYGIVDFDSTGQPRSAAFTGPACDDYKSHITGPDYAIQGNILSGQEVLDSMEARFLRTSGSLSDKLMAALQGANMPGADLRCLPEGVSSLSAFLRVARPNDSANNLYLDLLVGETPPGAEPIDSLQKLYDTFFATAVSSPATTDSAVIKIYPNPASSAINITFPTKEKNSNLHFFLYDLQGMLLKQTSGKADLIIRGEELGVGLYLYQLRQGKKVLKSGKVMIQ